MTIHFRSDISFQNTGFLAWYNSFPSGKCTLDHAYEAWWIYPAASLGASWFPKEINEGPQRCIAHSPSLSTGCVSLKEGQALGKAAKGADWGVTPGLGSATNFPGDLVTLLAEPPFSVWR